MSSRFPKPKSLTAHILELSVFYLCFEKPIHLTHVYVCIFGLIFSSEEPSWFYETHIPTAVGKVLSNYPCPTLEELRWGGFHIFSVKVPGGTTAEDSD